MTAIDVWEHHVEVRQKREFSIEVGPLELDIELYNMSRYVIEVVLDELPTSIPPVSKEQ
jgi:hypothetical protein